MMARHTRKVRVQDGDEWKTGTLVKITRQDLPQCEVELEDGTLITMTNMLVQAVRIDGEVDDAGNDKYVFTFTSNVGIHSASKRGGADERSH